MTLLPDFGPWVGPADGEEGARRHGHVDGDPSDGPGGGRVEALDLLVFGLRGFRPRQEAKCEDVEPMI
jgi:hypothetical protein